MKSSVIESIQEDLEYRERVGLEKYNTTVDRKDLSEDQWLQHAYEEALDFCVYLKKIINERKRIEEFKGKIYQQAQ